MFNVCIHGCWIESCILGCMVKLHWNIVSCSNIPNIHLNIFKTHTLHTQIVESACIIEKKQRPLLNRWNEVLKYILYVTSIG